MDTDDRMLNDAVGKNLVDGSAQKIGTIDTIYTDQQTGQPEWFAVRTGLFGRRVSFVPVQGAYFQEDAVVVSYDKDHVKNAPHAEPDGDLSQDEESALYRHYDMNYGQSRSDTQLPESAGGRGGDDAAMTRSEDELDVDKQRREAGTARLKKWVETEHQTVTIPVRRERAKLVTEPVTDQNRDQAMSGPDISEGEHEETLFEEEPVVETRTVPKERVRLEKESVTEDREVGADLRKERIETEGDVESTRRDR